MRALLWIFVVAAGSVVAYLVVGYVVAARLSAPVRQPVERTPAEAGLDCREVTVRSTDGLSLSAWWVGKDGSSRAAVLVHGWSMGGAAVVQVAPGTGVAVVVEEAAYADLPPLLWDRIPDASGLPAFFNPGIFLAGEFLLGIDPWAVRPEEEASRLSREGVPFMIIHSRDDRVIPFEHARSFVAAYPEATFWELKDYKHVAAHSHPEYEERLMTFLDEAMPSGHREDGKQ